MLVLIDSFYAFFQIETEKLLAHLVEEEMNRRSVGYSPSIDKSQCDARELNRFFSIYYMRSTYFNWFFSIHYMRGTIKIYKLLPQTHIMLL